ncbi:MAG: glycerophosphoryl diester phosphodiesterase membrane domain-containing protein [Novosphingobium sp.]
MKFDSNRAWREASAAVSANREVLLAVAGVFFLLPGLASVLFLSDFQADMMANFGNPAAAQRMMKGMTGPVVGFGLVSFVLQSIGYLAMLALLTDRTRPTVREAIGTAIKTLPSVIGAALLFFFGYMMAIVVVTLLAGTLRSVAGLGAVAAVLFVLLIGAVFYSAVKLSLVLPVIVIEKIHNPAAALARSWQLTRGNSLRLLAFYLLLALAYLVIIIVIGIVSMALTALLAGQGKVSMLIGGVISGVVGAAASALLTAILAAIHRQLAGPSPEAIGATFD